MTFKVGDRVKDISYECEGVVTNLTGHNGESTLLRIKRDDGIDGSPQKIGKWACNPKNLVLIKSGRPVKVKPVVYVVIYDEVDRDPTKIFTSKKDLTSWLKEAKEDSDVVWDSIRIFEVSKELRAKVHSKISLRKI